MLRIAILCAAALAPALSAELIETVFPGKAEAAVAADFEAALTPFLGKHVTDTDKPRVRMVQNKREVWLELAEVRDGELTWAELARLDWKPEILDFFFKPTETRYKLKVSDLPPPQVASWFNPEGGSQPEIVGLAAWLVSKKELTAANEVLAAFSVSQPPLKVEIDAWLAAKHGWAAGSTLNLVEVHNLLLNRDSNLLLTKDVAAQRLKDLDKEAKDALKELHRVQGNDTKSMPGTRKVSPGVRLDVLQSRIERFTKAYAGTPFLDNKTTRKTLDDLIAAVKGDREWVETQGFKAEREAIDGRIQESADLWLLILKADPENATGYFKKNPTDPANSPGVVDMAAIACNRAANVRNLKDKGLVADRADRALKAAELYVHISEIMPAKLAPLNFAAMNYMAGGEKGKARNLFNEVLRRTNKKELSSNEKENRDYAQDRLKDLK